MEETSRGPVGPTQDICGALTCDGHLLVSSRAYWNIEPRRPWFPRRCDEVLVRLSGGSYRTVTPCVLAALRCDVCETVTIGSICAHETQPREGWIFAFSPLRWVSGRDAWRPGFLWPVEPKGQDGRVAESLGGRHPTFLLPRRGYHAWRCDQCGSLRVAYGADDAPCVRKSTEVAISNPQ